MMMNNEQLLNQIELLKQALLFYAEAKNYEVTNNSSMILADKGHQAKFALERIKDIDKSNIDIEEEYKKYLIDGGNIDLNEINNLHSMNRDYNENGVNFDDEFYEQFGVK